MGTRQSMEETRNQIKESKSFIHTDQRNNLPNQLIELSCTNWHPPIWINEEQLTNLISWLIKPLCRLLSSLSRLSYLFAYLLCDPPLFSVFFSTIVKYREGFFVMSFAYPAFVEFDYQIMIEIENHDHNWKSVNRE